MALGACVDVGEGGAPSGRIAQGPESPSGDREAPPSQAPSSGADFWQAQCAGCHGAFEGTASISSGNDAGDLRLDASAAVLEHADMLASYIEASMPLSSPGTCTGPCAEETADYIRARVPPPEADPCEGVPERTQGVRAMRLLTSTEYARSVADLLGVSGDYGARVANNDGERGGFPNMAGQTVNGTTLDNYIRNAEAIAARAVAEGRPFPCPDGRCGERFVDEFLFRAFRGPPTAEQRAAYLDLFERYPDDGLQLALEAALTSPYFLYRIEAGVTVAAAREQGFYTGVDRSPPPPTSGAGAALATETTEGWQGGAGRREGETWVFLQNGGYGFTFDADFPDPAYIDVEARGTPYGDIWPELTLRVNGQEVGRQIVDDPELRIYRFEVTGASGRPRVRVEFMNDAGAPPYGPGQDVNLAVRQVTLLDPTAPPMPPPPADPPPTDDADVLDGVAEDVYVLTPYELATALSFMLTGSTPDAPLLEAARRDQLTTKAQIREQVVRLLDSEAGRRHLGDFVAHWFELDEVFDAARPDVPELTPEVKAAMVREVQEHFLHVVYDEDVPFRDFYAGDYTFLNRTLAEFYGVPGRFGDEFRRVQIEGRGGPIASGAFMTVNAHAERSAPILRAVSARENALCHHIEDPSSPIAGEDIDAQRAAAQARVAEREAEEGALSSRDFYFAYTDGIDACAVCHEKIINPMFGLEDFDHVGRMRPRAGRDTVLETIRGLEKPVSLSGTLIGVASTSDPTEIRYAGAKDFSTKIADTDAVKTCLVRKAFRFMTGLPASDRDVDTGDRERLSEDARRTFRCVAHRMKDHFLESGESPRAMLIALATESLVRLRR